MTNGPRVPIVRLFDHLIVCIQSDLDDALAERLRTDVASLVSETAVRGLIIDVSNVELLDSFVTRCLHELALMARLMGVPTVLAGLRPAVVVTLVEMGMEVGGVSTALNLEHALEILGATSHVDSEPQLETAEPDTT